MTDARKAPTSQAAAVSGRLPAWAPPLLIFSAVVLAYWPVLSAGFIWDDDGHVTPPDLRSLHGLWRIWFEVGATQQYYPVLHSAFWIEHRLWGDSATGYHLLNILLHAAAACLFAAVLKQLLLLQGRAANGSAPSARSDDRTAHAAGLTAWFAAAIFALHPVGVETVAWIAEQKNTLSTAFYLLSALAYLRFDGTRRAAWYAAGLCLFGLALLTKSVTATLPAALLVALWWRRGRLSWRMDVLPLLPWMAMSAGAGAVTVWIERHYIGAQGGQFDLGFADRILVAGRAAVFYLTKLAWPHPLVFIYPHWTPDTGSLSQWLFPAAVLAFLALLGFLCRRTRGPLAAALCFLGALFPALGFFNVYPFVFSYVADHFQYLASFAFCAAAASGLGALRRLFPAASRPLTAAAGVLLIALGGLTWKQSAVYHDSKTLYETTLAHNPDCWLAHDNLGVLLAHEGRGDEAIAHYEAAARLNPNYPETFNNLGNAWANRKRWNDAFAAYATAIRLRPGFVEAQINWGNALGAAGAEAEATVHYEAALRMQPRSPEALYRFGNALANSGRLAEAMDRYTEALRARPDYPEAEANLGLALATAHRAIDALPHLERAVRLSPRYAEAHAYLGFALAQVGRFSEAIAQYRESLALHPNDPDVHYQLGAALQALGNLRQAAEEFEAANQASRHRH